MRDIGLVDVRDESWPVSRGWTRIHARARIVRPSTQSVTVASMGWAGSTPEGGVEAEVVAVDRNNLVAELASDHSQWAGKILFLVPRPPDISPLAAYERMSAFLEAAEAAGAVGIVDASGTPNSLGMNLPHVTMADLSGRFLPIPMVALAGEHRLIIERLLDAGETVRMHLDVANEVTDGPVTSGNVIGEIPGGSSAEEIVVIGAHLDSWDLGQGATDDGFGVAAVLGAAKAIRESGLSPRRTLRFILFGGEEIGMLGSIDYLNTYADELANHRGAVMMDQGGGGVIGLQTSGRADLVDVVRGGVVSLDFGRELQVTDDLMILGDSYQFMTRRIPAIDLTQAILRNGYLHHTAADTVDKVDPETLTEATAVLAGLAFWLADSPAWQPPPVASETIESTLDGYTLLPLLEAVGWWPVTGP